jgi:hypothetical protein
MIYIKLSTYNMNFGGLQNMLGQMGGMGGLGGGGPTRAIPDSSETIIISSLALLKMLKHGRAGVPMEVMGLMLGSFIGKTTFNFISSLYINNFQTFSKSISGSKRILYKKTKRFKLISKMSTQPK